MADIDPDEDDKPARSMVGVGVAVGAAIGAALFAATSQPFWIGLGAVGGVGVVWVLKSRDGD